jgi:endo-1,4-beta-mannosidase
VGADRGVFRLGINYWPAATAMAWLDVDDRAGTRRDFARIAAAGFDTIRVFVRWEDAQPSAQRIDPHVLGRLVDAADAAHEVGVELIVTLFVGHMSGVNWIPQWALGGTPGDPRFRVVSGGRVRVPGTAVRNWYTDDAVLEAQEKLAAAAASALCGHPGVWAWDLGNENSNCTVPPTTAAGEAWLERITGAIRRGDPGRPVTAGIHMEDLEQDRGIGPAEVARWCDVVSMHGYPIYAGWSDGPADPHVVPFLGLLTRWLSSGAPVFLEEFGLPTIPVVGELSPMAVDESVAARYTGSVLDGLRAQGAIGAALWCYSDYSDDLFKQAPLDDAVHERTFGLWHADGTPKPAVAEASARAGRRCVAPSGTGVFDLTPQEFAADRPGQIARLYRRYRDAAAGAGIPAPGAADRHAGG